MNQIWLRLLAMTGLIALASAIALLARRQWRSTVTARALRDVDITVASMVCGGCAEHVTETLIAVPGVASVTPSVPNRRVCVRYAPEQIDEAGLRAALETARIHVVTEKEK